jgi:twinkle protein
VTKTTGAKIRVLPKEFYTAGELSGLFGQPLFNGGRLLVITEGEIDALTVAQSWYEKYNTFYPVVSISSAAGVKAMIKQRQWILSFDEVILWLDDDDPGREATEEAARALFREGKKIKVVTPLSGCKDASDVYRNNSVFDEKSGELIQGPGKDAVLNCIWRAREWSPAGIVTSANTWDMYKKEKSAIYIPFAPVLDCINKTNYGRRLGSITMITAGTGMGKTLLLKEDMYHLHKTRPITERIGVLSLEESVYEFVAGIMALEANKRIQLPDCEVTDEEERAYWEATMGSDQFIMLDHQGSVADDSIVTKIEYMILQGATYIYLDHVTIAVSESGSSQNAAIDKLMSDLLKLAKRWNVWIGVVSHLRKTDKGEKSFEAGAVPSEDDLKGSGSLKQIPMQTLALSRNKYADDPMERNKTHIHMLKDRYTGRTGQFVGSFSFDDDTGRLFTAGGFQAIEDSSHGFVAESTGTF